MLSIVRNISADNTLLTLTFTQFCYKFCTVYCGAVPVICGSKGEYELTNTAGCEPLLLCICVWHIFSQVILFLPLYFVPRFLYNKSKHYACNLELDRYFKLI